MAVGEAAGAVLELGQAEAESKRLKAEAEIIEREAELLTDDSVVKYLLSKNAPALAGHMTDAVAAAFKPLEKIEGMRILQVNTDGGTGSNGSPMNDIMRNITQNAPAGAIVNEILEMSGSELKLKDILEKVVTTATTGLQAGLQDVSDTITLDDS